MLDGCSHYYMCQNQQPVEQSCPEGLLFDAKTQNCTSPDKARCFRNCTLQGIYSFSYDNTCNKYVLCFAGTPVIRKCADGLQYNSETNRCDFSQHVDCVDNMCTILSDANNVKFLSSKAACDKYFICMLGMAISRNCSKGLQFNPKCECCDIPSKANCKIPSLQRDVLPPSRAPPKAADIKCPTDGVNFNSHDNEDKYYFCVNSKMEACRENKSISKECK